MDAKRTKIELAEYAASIINTVREPLITLDQDLRVVTASRSFYEIFKVKPKETIGQLIYHLGNKQWDIPKLRELLETILPEKTSFDDYEVEHDFATIGRRTMLLNARQIEQSKGKKRVILLAIEDITQRKEIEAGLETTRIELEALARELERADRVKSEFLASMSHELRTPLNAIIGFSEVLQDGLIGEITEQQKKYIGNIFESGQHLLSLVNDVLDLSKLEAGKMNLDLEILEPASLLRGSLIMVKEKAMLQGIILKENMPTELGLMQCDGRKLKQIIYNLLSNAVKFIPDGGEVTLNARRVPRSKAHLVAVNELWKIREIGAAENVMGDFEEFLEIAVHDTGIGISCDDLDKLFQPFSQIDSSLSRKYEGTGLGLMMVQNLVHLHGGAAAVASAAGLGSCFTFWLPWRDASFGNEISISELPPTITEKNYDDIGEEHTTIPLAILVEADKKSAELINISLKEEGFAVHHVQSAEEALRVLERVTPALITLDIQCLEWTDGSFLVGVNRYLH
ncbi:hybrid sensor histidine kinase/response regulator [Paraglaciecola sp. L1A13]|uniref:hybrid sensor histidine kinase/response regulator n=1 Tax=Paraglaciecola sp. L1A13 TaxID=2686359 RepID=UPI00131EA7A4|nr:ATP-binding protein [Paraglaciecola sp. L1A13]